MESKLLSRSPMKKTKFLLATLITAALSLTGFVPAQAEGEVSTYTITYSTSGSSGGLAPVEQEVSTDPDVTSVTATVASNRTLFKSGFEFRGWTTGANGAGTLYISGSNIVLTANITLYPAFGGTLTFAANGGTGSAASTTADYTLGRAITLPLVGTLARTNYKFLGWRKDLAVKTYQAGGSSYTVTEATTGNFSLYATWGRSVTFNLNGATIGSTPAEMIWVDTDVPLVLKTPAEAGLKKRGFDHTGWSTSLSGSPVSNNFLPTLAEQVLYASWVAQPTQQTFRIDFRTNKKTLLSYSNSRLSRMLSILDPQAVFPKQRIVVFLQSKRFVTQSSALGKARIKYVRKALRDAGITAKVVWSNETRSGGSAREAKNNRVIAKVQWVN